MVAWNTQIIIFDWCEYFFMGISFLFFDLCVQYPTFFLNPATGMINWGK
jgi:hypothetical protein